MPAASRLTPEPLSRWGRLPLAPPRCATRSLRHPFSAPSLSASFRRCVRLYVRPAPSAVLLSPSLLAVTSLCPCESARALGERSSSGEHGEVAGVASSVKKRPLKIPVYERGAGLCQITHHRSMTHLKLSIDQKVTSRRGVIAPSQLDVTARLRHSRNRSRARLPCA